MLDLDPHALDDAAARIDAAAASLSCLDVAGPFGLASRAVPGSETGAACGFAAADLVAAVDAWVRHLRRLCEAARLVARDVAATDAEVARGLSGTRTSELPGRGGVAP